MSWAVFNQHGQRKYLTPTETDAFVKAADKHSIDVRAFCWTMAFTGCRISEALSLTRQCFDFGSEQIIIKCLKKRGKSVFRAIPLPPIFLRLLKRWFEAKQPGSQKLWPWSRMTGYRRIREVMSDAGICGSYASPKGLRHGFGVRAIQASVPLTLVQRWLGHADIKTTAIYTSATGPEEREIASRMWRRRPIKRENSYLARDWPCESDELCRPSEEFGRYLEPGLIVKRPRHDDILTDLASVEGFCSLEDRNRSGSPQSCGGRLDGEVCRNRSVFFEERETVSIDDLP
jgi:hypothetical protein